jgi:hypothetical protein
MNLTIMDDTDSEHIRMLFLITIIRINLFLKTMQHQCSHHMSVIEVHQSIWI